jgi:hypothetical protein
MCAENVGVPSIISGQGITRVDIASHAPIKIVKGGTQIIKNCRGTGAKKGQYGCSQKLNGINLDGN